MKKNTERMMKYLFLPVTLAIFKKSDNANFGKVLTFLVGK